MKKAWSDAARTAASAARRVGGLFTNKDTRGEVMGAVGTAGGIAGTATALQRMKQDREKPAPKIVVQVNKDWATWDRERGPGEKTGRMAGTMAGIAGAAHVGARLLRSKTVRRLAGRGRLGAAAVGAYGAFQGLRTAGGYVGRKVDEATGRVFKADPIIGPGLGIPMSLARDAPPSKPRPRTAQGMVQGRGRVNAGPGRWGGGPDIVKGYATGRAVELVKGSVEQTMHEYKHGTLRSGSKHGPKVKSRAQAIAIAMSQSGQSNQ